VTQVFLGIIAMATLVMALVQVGFILYAWAIARRLSRVVDQLEREMKPVLDALTAMARDAAHASALAVVQVERVDRLFTELTDRIEQTATTVQRAIITPFREGAAVMAGIKAVLSVLKDMTGRSGSATRTEDEDALFIG
jgi:ribosomal protein L17